MDQQVQQPPSDSVSPVQAGVSSLPANQSPRRKNKVLYFVLFFMLLFSSGISFAFGYFQASFENSTLTPQTKVQASEDQKETLVVGTDPTYKPMEYLENEKLVGYDIDLANFIAQEMEAQVEFKKIPFDNLFSALENNEVDMIISGVTITDERKQKYAFSEPYLNAGQVIITVKTDTSITSTKDLQGKRISVQKGTTNETEALKYTNASLVVRAENFDLATKALVDGQADAIFTDLPNAKGIIEANPTLKIASDPFINQYYGIVLRKGDSRLNSANEALASLQVKGILTELRQKWLD